MKQPFKLTKNRLREQPVLADSGYKLRCKLQLVCSRLLRRTGPSTPVMMYSSSRPKPAPPVFGSCHKLKVGRKFEPFKVQLVIVLTFGHELT